MYNKSDLGNKHNIGCYIDGKKVAKLLCCFNYMIPGQNTFILPHQKYLSKDLSTLFQKIKISKINYQIDHLKRVFINYEQQ